MTVIITIKEDDKIYLGSDRMISSDSTKTHSSTPKYFKKEFQTYTPKTEEDGDITQTNFKQHYLIFAGAGSDAISNYIKYAFRFPDKIESDPFETYLLLDVLPALRDELKNAGLLKIDAGGVSDTESNFLLIYDNEVYPIYRELGYTPRSEDFCVIGIADEIALGSLYTTKNEADSEYRIKVAIEACAYHSLFVDSNIDIVTITNDDYIFND